MTAPPTPSVIGPFLGTPHVRAAVVATLERWLPTYVAEARRITGLDLPDFIDFVNEPMMSTADAGESPRYVVAVPRTIGEPRRKGDGTYIAEFDVQVALWLWGADYRSTQDLVGHYLITARDLMLQHPSLDGFASGLRWIGETYAEPSVTTFRTWGQGVLRLGVTVDGVASAYAGPPVPPADPSQPLTAPPAVTSAHITVIPLES